MRILLHLSFLLILGCTSAPKKRVDLSLAGLTKTYKTIGTQGKRKSQGTAFLIQAPSGITYLMTAGHICRGQELIYVLLGERYFARAILERNDYIDLCLLEGLPGKTGMPLAAQEPEIGSRVVQMGFPDNAKDVVVSRGMIFAAEDREQQILIVKKPEHQLQCEQRGFFLSTVNNAIWCAINIASYNLTTLSYPGSSGSSVVNDKGEVVSLTWGTTISNNNGVGVQYKHLKEFLSVY